MVHSVQMFGKKCFPSACSSVVRGDNDRKQSRLTGSDNILNTGNHSQFFSVSLLFLYTGCGANVTAMIEIENRKR